MTRLLKRCILAALVLAGLGIGAQAETRNTSVSFQAVCGDRSDPFYVGTHVDLMMDGSPIQPGFSNFLELGAHSLKIALKPPKDAEGKWLIRKIEQPAEPHGPARRLLQAPDAVETTVALNIPPQESDFDWIPTDVYVTVDVCARIVKLKIATTISCNGTPGEDFKAQKGVTVNIGGRTFTSDEKGVIEADVPMGTYPVAAA